MPRIALCGGLMIGVDSIEPNTPPLEIENVPPVSSSIVELAVSRALARSRRSPSRSRRSRQLVGVAQHRHHQPALGCPPRRRCRSSRGRRCRCRRPRRSRPGTCFSACDRGLHEERHEAELHAVLLLEAVLVAARAGPCTGCMLTSLKVVRIAAVDCDCTQALGDALRAGATSARAARCGRSRVEVDADGGRGAARRARAARGAAPVPRRGRAARRPW